MYCIIFKVYNIELEFNLHIRYFIMFFFMFVNVIIVLVFCNLGFLNDPVLYISIYGTLISHFFVINVVVKKTYILHSILSYY